MSVEDVVGLVLRSRCSRTSSTRCSRRRSSDDSALEAAMLAMSSSRSASVFTLLFATVPGPLLDELAELAPVAALVVRSFSSRPAARAVSRPRAGAAAAAPATVSSCRSSALIYRIVGVDPTREQPWTVYALSLLAFSSRLRRRALRAPAHPGRAPAQPDRRRRPSRRRSRSTRRRASSRTRTGRTTAASRR